MIIVFILCCGAIVLVAKINIPHLNYDEYLENSMYYLLPEEQFRLMYHFENIYIHSSIENIDDLMLKTETILVVTVQDEPEFIGNGIINHCKVEQVISGDELEEGDYVEIYDLIAWWKMSSTAYLGGCTPLKSNDKYMVFLNKAPRPNKKDTYVYSSIPYGHIALDDFSEVLVNDESSPITVKEAANYQFIFPQNTEPEEIDLYNKTCNELIYNLLDVSYVQKTVIYSKSP